MLKLLDIEWVDRRKQNMIFGFVGKFHEKLLVQLYPMFDFNWYMVLECLLVEELSLTTSIIWQQESGVIKSALWLKYLVLELLFSLL